MTFREPWDAIEAGLAGLSIYDADLERVERIRTRCMAALAAQRRMKQGRRARLAAWRQWLEPAVAFCLSALYLAVAVSSALALLR